MQNTIAGVSLTIASVICLLALAFMDRTHGGDGTLAFAWLANFIAGLCFFARGKQTSIHLEGEKGKN